MKEDVRWYCLPEASHVRYKAKSMMSLVSFLASAQTVLKRIITERHFISGSVRYCFLGIFDVCTVAFAPPGKTPAHAYQLSGHNTASPANTFSRRDADQGTEKTLQVNMHDVDAGVV